MNATDAAAACHLPDTQRVRMIIDGLSLTTTMGDLRRYGAGSACISRMVQDFEESRFGDAAAGKPPCIGFGSTYRDFDGKTRNLQIDLLTDPNKT